MKTSVLQRFVHSVVVIGALCATPTVLWGQGVTTAAINGFVTGEGRAPIVDATVVAVHQPSGTQYRAVTRTGGAYSLPNLRVGGPYRITATAIGFQPRSEENVFLTLAENSRHDFQLTPQTVQLEEIAVTGERDEVLNAGRPVRRPSSRRRKCWRFRRSSAVPAT